MKAKAVIAGAALAKDRTVPAGMPDRSPRYAAVYHLWTVYLHMGLLNNCSGRSSMARR